MAACIGAAAFGSLTWCLFLCLLFGMSVISCKTLSYSRQELLDIGFKHNITITASFHHTIVPLAWRESTLSYRKALKTARTDYFLSLLEENKHNPRYLFNTVAKLTNNKASTGVDISQQHSSNDFMNYFTSKIDTIRDQIVTM